MDQRSDFLKSHPPRSNFAEIPPLKIPIGQLQHRQENATLQPPGKIFKKVPHLVSPLFVPTQSSSTLQEGSYELRKGSGSKKKTQKGGGMNGTLLSPANHLDPRIMARFYLIFLKSRQVIGKTLKQSSHPLSSYTLKDTTSTICKVW